MQHLILWLYLHWLAQLASLRPTSRMFLRHCSKKLISKKRKEFDYKKSNIYALVRCHGFYPYSFLRYYILCGRFVADEKFLQIPVAKFVEECFISTKASNTERLAYN